MQRLVIYNPKMRAIGDYYLINHCFLLDIDGKKKESSTFFPKFDLNNKKWFSLHVPV